MTCNFCGHAIDEGRDRLFVKDNFPIVRCPQCGLVCRGTIPADEELKSIYADAYFFSDQGDTASQGYQNYLDDEQYLRLNFRRRLDRIQKFVHQPGRILDVGSASGFFLDEARQRGWSVKGVEYSNTMADLARTKLQLDVWTGKFQDFHDQAGTYDVVTMWDYLEHSVDPAGDLRQIQTLLKPGGLMALSTGDVSSLMAKLSRTRWHLLTPRHHIFYHSPAVIKPFLEKIGFRDVHISHPPEMYSIAYLTYKLYTTLPWWPVRALANGLRGSRLGTLTVPMNLFDIMTVYARKG